jgi:hypothetical protein
MSRKVGLFAEKSGKKFAAADNKTSLVIVNAHV